MEILQGLLTTTRSADYIDMLFNTFGTVVALLFMRKYEKLFR
jgi:vanZ family protein